MYVHRFGAELPLITLTLWLQSAGIAALVAWIRRTFEGDARQIGALRSVALVVRLTAAVVAPARAGDSAVGRLLSLAVLTVMGLGVLLLSKQLFNARL